MHPLSRLGPRTVGLALQKASWHYYALFLYNAMKMTKMAVFYKKYFFFDRELAWCPLKPFGYVNSQLHVL